MKNPMKSYLNDTLIPNYSFVNHDHPQTSPIHRWRPIRGRSETPVPRGSSALAAVCAGGEPQVGTTTVMALNRYF